MTRVRDLPVHAGGRLPIGRPSGGAAPGDAGRSPAVPMTAIAPSGPRLCRPLRNPAPAAIAWRPQGEMMETP